MISLRWESEGLKPIYKSQYSAGCDLRSRVDLVLCGGEQVKVPTGVFIDRVDWDLVPSGMIPELQIRARSGLSYQAGICLTNGIGTVDCDYPEEICVLLWNTRKTDFIIQKADRIAQLSLNLVSQMAHIAVEGKRSSGFGSTGLK